MTASRPSLHARARLSLAALALASACGAGTPSKDEGDAAATVVVEPLAAVPDGAAPDGAAGGQDAPDAPSPAASPAPEPDTAPIDPAGPLAGAGGDCGVGDDLHDRRVGAPEPRFEDLLAATEVPAVSPVEPGAGDLVVEYGDMVDPARLRVVVRKPVPRDGVHLIEDVPRDPEAAWRRVTDEFETAAESGVGTIRFEKDARITLANPKPGGAHLALEGLTDVVVDFDGATLAFARAATGIVVKDARRVVFENGTLVGHGLLASVAMTEADPGSPAGVRFRVLDPYVAPLEAEFEAAGEKPRLLTVGKAGQTPDGWRIDARGSSDLFVNRGGELDRWAWRTEGTGDAKVAWFAATSGTSAPERLPAPGQPVYLLHRNNDGTGFVLKNTDGDVEDVTLRNMTLTNIPGMGVFGEVNRGLHLDGVRVVPDPDDPLAVWGSSSDAVHLNNNGGDVIVENSTFGGSADDLFTAKGNWWKVTALDRVAGTATVENVDRSYGVHLWARAGDRLVVIGEDMNVVGGTTHAEDSYKDASKRHDLYLDEVPPAMEIGSLVANPDRAGGRIVVRDNVYENSRAQGVLVQARHVVVENNAFRNIAGPAVKLNFALRDWYESVSVGNVVIADNTFESTGVGATKPPHAVHLSQEDAAGRPIRIIDDVRLSGNRAVGCP